MKEEEFETVKRNFSYIERGDCVDKVKCFADAVGIIAVQGGFHNAEKYTVYDKLSKNMELIFPFLGLEKTIMNETDIEVALTHGIWDMLDSYMNSFEREVVLTDKDRLMKMLTRLDEIKERVDDLENIDDLFDGLLYISYDHLFPLLLNVIDNKYTYEVNQYRKHIVVE